MSASTAFGYAIADPEIDVKTVSPTRTAAIVNWLIGKGCMVLQHVPDHAVERAWEAERGSARLVEIIINEAQVSPPPPSPMQGGAS